jgi:hypothetical protein
MSAWNGTPVDWKRIANAAEAAGSEVVVGNWPAATLNRMSPVDKATSNDRKIVFLPDDDEIVDQSLLDRLKRGE